MPDPSPKLVTLPNVEICEVGEEWELSTGPLTITPEGISKFLAGIDNDPAVHAPRLRFGHTDDWPVASEPAFGRYTNLRATNDGNTLVGDIAGVPEWFAEIAPAAWPNRSLDGWEDATTHTGNKYPLLIDAVSFLGVKLPGINTLEDLAAVWAADPPAGTSVDAGTPITATRGGAMAKPVAAAVGTTDLLKAFYNDFAQGDRYWWWIRQTFLDPAILIVDDDEGSLWALEYSIAGDAVEFGEPYEVVTQYVNKENGQVAASLAERLQTGGQAAAVYASAAESRPQDRKKEDDVAKPTKASTATVDKEALLKKLGLPEDASDEDIQAALAAEETPEPTPPADPDAEPDEDEADDDDDDEADEDENEGDEATATRTVPAAEWKSTQERLAAHDKREAERESKRRDGVVAQACKEGRIARARTKAWRTKMDKDPEGTETLLTAAEDKGGLPKNMVPVDETGVQTGDEVDATGMDSAQEAYYATHFPELATAGKE